MTSLIKKLIPVAMLTLGISLTSGCSTTAPMIDTSPDAEVTFDGLTKVEGSSADEAWARADLDLSMYSRIILQGAGIEYRPDGESRRTSMVRSSAKHFEVTDSQKERLGSVVAEAFLKELGQSQKYTIVSEPGPDVLLVRGALLDVVSYVPPETVGRSEIYLRSVGEATLVLELRDSTTDAILARVVDRRAAEDVSGNLR